MPEKSADGDSAFVERVRHVLPYLRLVMKDEYEPARWRADLFWTSPATLSNVAEYGDLTEDETAEIGEIITEWIKEEKGSERFEALGEKERRHFIQDVLVPEAAVGLVLASLGEEPWLETTTNGNGEAVKVDEPIVNGNDAAKDSAPIQPETTTDDANQKAIDAPASDAEMTEAPAPQTAAQPEPTTEAPEHAVETSTDTQTGEAKEEAPVEDAAANDDSAPEANEPNAASAGPAPTTEQPAESSADAETPAATEAPSAEPATEIPEREAERPAPNAGAAEPESQPEQPAEPIAPSANGASDAMDVDPTAEPPIEYPAEPVSEDTVKPDAKPDPHSAYTAARAQLADLRAAASHKQWAMRQTEVLRARRERRAKLKLPSELETEEDRAEAGVADGTLGRSARGRVRRKVNYKDP